MEKMASDRPKWCQEDFFDTNPDLADFFGRTDLNFENFYFRYFLIPNFWISKSPEFQISRNLAWARLDPSWAGPVTHHFNAVGRCSHVPQTELALRVSYGVGRGGLKVLCALVLVSLQV